MMTLDLAQFPPATNPDGYEHRRQIVDWLISLKAALPDLLATNLEAVSVTGNATMQDEAAVYLCQGTLTLTLPPAEDAREEKPYVKNIGTGTVTVAAQGGELVDGAATLVLAVQYSSVTLYSDGAAWWVL